MFSFAIQRQQILLYFILGLVLLNLESIYAQDQFTIDSVSPADGATGVSVSSVVTVTFNESVDASTVNNSTFTVEAGNLSIPGTLTVSVDGKTATFDATPDLSPNTKYTATIDTAVKALSGSLLAKNQSWSFTTGSVSVSPTSTIQGFADPNLILYFIFIVAAAMVIPLVIDMFLANFRLRKTTGDRGYGTPVGMDGLYRTLMTFGIILLLGMVIFYVLWLLTQNIRNEASQPLLNILQNLSTILGTALATIIAFYFGMRGSAASVEAATKLAQQQPEKPGPPATGPIPEKPLAAARETRTTGYGSNTRKAIAAARETRTTGYGSNTTRTIEEARETRTTGYGSNTTRTIEEARETRTTGYGSNTTRTIAAARETRTTGYGSNTTRTIAAARETRTTGYGSNTTRTIEEARETRTTGYGSNTTRTIEEAKETRTTRARRDKIKNIRIIQYAMDIMS